MSSIYIQEPPTEGKVLLKTSFGELDIELWSREAPKACRNFVQLCLEGFYNGLIFHRVVKRFIAQTGDPTGTGCTSVSVYGAPFKDEIHSRLRFNRRGLVALANNGRDDNGSQFFFTLDETPELQGKHTIFGKVAGDTLYNLIKLNEIEIDHDERPVYEQKIIKTKVLKNPFPDIVPRISISSKEPVVTKDDEKNKNKESGVKNFKLLSFGDEAEEDEIETSVEQTKYLGKSKSTHDVLNDPKLSSKTIIDDDEEEEEDDTAKEQAKVDLEAVKSKLSSKPKDKNAKKEKTESKKEKKREKQENESDDDLDVDNYFEQQREKEKQKKLGELRKQVKDFKREYVKEQKSKTEKDDKNKKADEKSELRKEFEESQKNFVRVKEKLALKKDCNEVMKLFEQQLKSFRRHNNPDFGESSKTSGSDKKSSKDDSDEDLNSEEWFRSQIKAKADNILAKDANTKSDDWYDIYDPRNPLNKRRREPSKHHKSKKSKRE